MGYGIPFLTKVRYVRGDIMKGRKNHSSDYEVLSIEKSSLISNMDYIGPENQLDQEFGSRRILLFKYPQKRLAEIN